MLKAVHHPIHLKAALKMRVMIQTKARILKLMLTMRKRPKRRAKLPRRWRIQLTAA